MIRCLCVEEDGFDLGVWAFATMPRIGETVTLAGAPQDYTVVAIQHVPTGAANPRVVDTPPIPALRLRPDGEGRQS